MASSGRLYICTLVLFSIACPTKQNISPSKELQKSDVMHTVFRGTRSETDRVDVCSKTSSTELLFRTIASKRINCTEDATGKCGEKGGVGGYICTCPKDNPTYVVSERRCINNDWLRQDCTFRFGSWRYSSGWTWNELNDPLLSLYLDDGYGITGGFNASNMEFALCTLDNVTVLRENGVWGKIYFDSSDIKFFVYNRYYHISWNTENLDAERKQSIRGRILRLSIKCQPLEPILHNDVFHDPTESCLTLKVTGNFTASNDQQEPGGPDKKKEDHKVAIALGVTFSILLLVGIVAGVFCYRRQRSGTNITPRFLSDFMNKIT